MKRSRRVILIFLFVVVPFMTALITLGWYCPPQGIAFTQARRDFHRLKNRTALPQPSDFEAGVTLSSMLEPGEDWTRWSTSRAARVEGYVVAIAKARLELANCYSPCLRDTHIHVGFRRDAPPREHLVLEITPRMEDWAKSQGWDWSEETLKRELLGRWCSFEGWLFFDSHHAGESENIAPGRRLNWRATAWEIHPITNFEVIR